MLAFLRVDKGNTSLHRDCTESRDLNAMGRLNQQANQNNHAVFCDPC